ncbi:hypothetical protein CEE36_09810 [candidate division TA06 bacterium B3_TA06]|uniref:Fibronectin type-III domain-containing protein n=1 Tax=candidate division TA06 bacterium B3_TA06 TaxID=2012487 RepID=A0A532UYY4_UNCT6|nr:MAG: hypothetical protein CEE36_09810 [candidate division TA06 bacterium B3_TA06]
MIRQGGRMAKRFLVSAALIAVIFVALTGCGNHPPEIAGVTASPSTVEPAEETNITCTANDPDGNQMTYDWESVDEATAYMGQSFTWIAPIPDETPRTYRFYVTVSDGQGGVAYDSSLMVTVDYAGAPAVTLREPTDIGWTYVTLVWTQSQHPTWKTYQVYTSTSPGVKDNGQLIQIPNFPESRLDTSITIDDLEPGKTYYYAIAVIDSADHKTFSNEVAVNTRYFEILGQTSLGGGHGNRLASISNHIFCAVLEQSVKGFNIGGNSIVSGGNIVKPIPEAVAWDVYRSSNLLHVAFGKAGYHGYLIENPLNPIDTILTGGDVFTLTGSDYAEAVTVYAEGNDVFVGCRDQANQVHTITWLEIDLAGATAYVRGVDTLYDVPTDIHVDGNYIYVTEGNAGLEILRWDQNAEPDLAMTSVGITSTNDEAKALFVSRDYTYVAAFGEGLMIIDVANKNEPKRAGQWKADEGNQAFGVYVSGDRAYLADGEYGLRVLDVTDPKTPKHLGTIEVGSQIRDVWVIGQSGASTTAILADWYNAIYMVEWE